MVFKLAVGWGFRWFFEISNNFSKKFFWVFQFFPNSFFNAIGAKIVVSRDIIIIEM